MFARVGEVFIAAVKTQAAYHECYRSDVNKLGSYLNTRLLNLKYTTQQLLLLVLMDHVTICVIRNIVN